MNRLFFITATLLFGISDISIANRLPSQGDQKGITEGRLVEGSLSPDGKHALFEFNRWEGPHPTTVTGIGLARADRSNLLITINSRTEWMTNDKVTSFLTFLWNEDSTFLTTHDSGDKHSRLDIYHVSAGTATSLDIPDLLNTACEKLGIQRPSVSQSGQVPVKWLSRNTLLVSVRVTANGRKRTLSIPLHIDGDAKVSVGAESQPEKENL